MSYELGGDSTAPPSSLHNPREDYDWTRISAALDDAGLHDREFRLYCHLLRRADKSHQAWPGIRQIAEVCRMKRNSVCVGLAELERLGFISKNRTLTGILYTILPASSWGKVSQTGKCPKRDTTLGKRGTKRDTSGSIPNRTGCPKRDTQGVPNGIPPAPLSPPHTPPLISPPLEGNPEKKVIHEGNPFFSSPSSKTPPAKKRETVEPDRFPSEQEVIRFVFSDASCREVRALRADARWFWNTMVSQRWITKRGPVLDAPATLRKWMGADWRPSWKDRNKQEHIEQWRRESRLESPQEATLPGLDPNQEN